MGKVAKKKTGLNSKAAVTRILVESQPYYYYGTGGDIIPFGVDNLYPERIEKAIEESPTAKGCVERLRYFISGQGAEIGGDTVVNRDGQTLNQIISMAAADYAKFRGFALHCNFNLLGRVVEIFNVRYKYIRKRRSLRHVDIGIWDTRSNLFNDEYLTIDLYGVNSPIEGIRSHGLSYYGQVFYFAKDSDLYPDSQLQGSTLSAEYEREAQIYPYANIKNSFSANKLIKLMTRSVGEEAEKEVNEMELNLASLHGADVAGGSIVVQMPVDSMGDPKELKMVEDLSPTNVDTLFVNQNAAAQNNLLKTFMMPEELLGVFSKGSFSSQSYNDAFNMKNADTEQDRKAVENEFNKILGNSMFPVKSINIKPLEMKGGATQ